MLYTGDSVVNILISIVIVAIEVIVDIAIAFARSSVSSPIF